MRTLIEMNHPALYFSGLQIGGRLIEVTVVDGPIPHDDHPSSGSDTVRFLLKSSGVPDRIFNISAPRSDFEESEFRKRIHEIIEHAAKHGLTCELCPASIKEFHFLETGVCGYCIEGHAHRILALERPPYSPV